MLLLFLIYDIVHELCILELRWILEVYFLRTLSQIRNPIFNVIIDDHLILPQIVEFMDDVILLCDCYSNISDNILLEKDNLLLRIKLSQSDP